MNASIVKKNNKEIVIQVSIELKSNMLKTEESILESLNDAGCMATEQELLQFDTNGDPIMVNGLKYTSKGQIEKIYQTPYGEIRLPRHVYQSSQGGKTFCPLDKDARTIVYSTPKFAKTVSSKYSSVSGRAVQKDLKENHGRYISRGYIKDIGDIIGRIALSKEDKWSYSPPVPKDVVKTIGIGLDGTCMLMAEDGWRQAMVGTLAFYDGDRMNTIYLSAAPEYGKSNFIQKFENEITRVKKAYPNSNYIGIADGAKDNWTFLSKHTNTRVLDFYHASEYLTKIADITFNSKSKEKRAKWLTDSCHKLKHESGGAAELLNEFIGFRNKRMSAQKKEKLESSITYFSNHLDNMDYRNYLDKKIPIGSGITESACKVIVKQRFCNSGMKWKQASADAILCLRALNYSDGRWAEMWDKINRYGI